MNSSNPWLAAIVENSDDAIISKTLQGVITSWNAGAQRLFGYTVEEAVGQPINMLVPADRADEEPRILEKIARGERVDHFETVRVRKDGSLVPVSVTISPVRDDSGGIVGASKIARDIGEQKRSEARLRAQLDRLHLLDQVTRSIGSRHDLRSIYQVTLRSLEERLPLDLACILGRNDGAGELRVEHIGVHSADLAMDLALNESGRLPVDQNGLGRCLSGKLVYERDTRSLAFPFPQRLAQGGILSAVLSPLTSEGEVVGILVAGRRDPQAFTSTDCEFLLQLSTHVSLAAGHALLHASLKQAYEELKATQQAAARQERLRALGQMASGIAHDINNLVFPASAFAREVLEKEPGVSAQGREHLESVVRAMDDITESVQRLREFYRPRDAQEPLVRLNLNEVVGHVAALARHRCSQLQARGTQVELRIDTAPDLPDTVGSASEIRESLVNLSFNAIDAMPAGGTLSLVTRPYTAPGEVQAPLVIVQDTGVGMSEEVRRRCMDPFYTTKGENGTGMGLAMVYGTVQRHSAEMDIDSRPGAGTSVTLRFPPMPAAAPAQAPREPAPAVRPAAPGRSLRILVVDDDPLILEVLQHMLRAVGHTAFLANGGQAGINAFGQPALGGEPFDLVLTDLGMPRQDGKAVAAAVKAASPTTPVVLLTGWGEDWLEESPLPSIDAVMSKPPQLRELREVIARLVTR